MEKINIAIIGAGRIGAFFDKPGDKNILTHAHAFVSHPKFHLVGFVDSDYKKAKLAANRWGGSGYKDIKDLFNNEKVDVVSVCVSDTSHYKILQQLKKYNFKGGIIEKPLSDNIKHSKKIIDDKFFRNKFLVNYSLRYTPEFVLLKKKIEDNEYGQFICGNGYYGKGLVHNGSHLIDLISFFGMDIKKIDITNKIYDFSKTDPTYSIMCHLNKKGLFVLQGISSKKYTVFEIDLLFDKARIRIKDKTLSVEFYDVQKDVNFHGYRNLVLKGTSETSRLTKSMYNMAEDLYKIIQYNKKPSCSVFDAYKIQKLLSL